MEIIKTMNEVTELYARGLNETDEGWECPVCKKVYKRKPAADKHIDKMDCYRLQDVFDDTEYEHLAKELWASVMAHEHPRMRTTRNVFRKNRMYGPFLRFILYTTLNQVMDKGLYFSWLNEIAGYKYTNKILAEGVKDDQLRAYRIWLQKHPDYIDSETFIERHGQQLVDDPHFFIRSVEKSHVSIEALDKCQGFPLASVVHELPIDYWNRLDFILSQLEK